VDGKLPDRKKRGQRTSKKPGKKSHYLKRRNLPGRQFGRKIGQGVKTGEKKPVKKAHAAPNGEKRLNLPVKKNPL